MDVPMDGPLNPFLVAMAAMGGWLVRHYAGRMDRDFRQMKEDIEDIKIEQARLDERLSNIEDQS